MRELKFRMWTGTNMLYDDKNVIECLKQQRFFDTGIKLQPEIGVWPYDHISDGSAFMQYVGLKDKTGKDIYEGDIIKSINITMYGGKREIQWHDKICAWVGVTKNVKPILLYDFVNPEVVGNIYQHKHLLK